MSVEEFDRRVAAIKDHPLFTGRYMNLTFPPGWLGLIECLVADIEALPDGNTLQCRQIKEKWGSLRLYVDAGGNQNGLDIEPSQPFRADGELRQRAEALILEAEKASESLCYLCGQSVTIRPPWLSRPLSFGF